MCNADRYCLEVIGKAKLSVVPDEAWVTFKIQAQHDSVGQASSLQAEKTSKLISTLEKLGLNESEVKTSAYSCSPIFIQNEKAERVFKGYEVIQRIVAKVSKNQLSSVIDSAKDLATVETITFKNSQQEDIREKAVLQAIEDAKKKAQVRAKTLGVQLTGVLGCSPNVGSRRVGYVGFSASRQERSVAPVFPEGESEIEAEAVVYFDIRNPISQAS